MAKESEQPYRPLQPLAVALKHALIGAGVVSADELRARIEIIDQAGYR